MTQAILLYDAMVLEMSALLGTPDFIWREPKPSSDKVTRLLGNDIHLFHLNNCIVYLAVIMSEEKDPLIEKAVVWLQKRQESLKEGFFVHVDEKEYFFLPEYIDRYVGFSC